MAFNSDACRVDEDGGAVGYYGLLRAWRIIWTLQPNSFTKVGQAEKRVKSLIARPRIEDFELVSFLVIRSV